MSEDEAFDEAGLEEFEAETPPVERDAIGRFKGSGNPRGRPPKYTIPANPRLPASRRRILNEVADLPVTVKIDGKPQEMSLYKANVLCLAKAGTTDRVAAQKFIEMMMQIADTELARSLTSMQFIERMNARDAELARLRQKVGANGGAVTVDIALDDWDPERMIDDETGVIDLTRNWRENPPDKTKPIKDRGGKPIMVRR